MNQEAKKEAEASSEEEEKAAPWISLK
jgi:hypothetical protein